MKREENYEPFGKEWKEQVMKISKTYLIDVLLKPALIKLKDIESTTQPTQSAVEIAAKYVYVNHDALTDRQEVIDMAKDIEAYANQQKEVSDEILQKAIDKWGVHAQLEMIIEECLELALALQKSKRLSGNMMQKEKNVIDEIADVKIMIKQAEKIFGLESVNERVNFKMKRLEKRLNDNDFKLTK